MSLGMKKWITIISMMFFCLLVFPVSVKAAYSPSSAVNYAQSHCASGHTSGSSNCPNSWLCAEFVSKCLQAGGMSNTTQTGCRQLYNELTKYGTSYTLTVDSNGAVNVNNNSGKISVGDVIITHCNVHDLYLHAVLVSSFDSSGYVYDYAHNANKMNQKLTASRWCSKKGGNESYSNITAYVIHFPQAEVVQDTTLPTISNASITDVSNEGYTVSCTVSDNVEVYMVAFNTMATNHQRWVFSDPVNKTTESVQYRVDTKDYGYVDGNYTTEIYVYDTSNNRSVYQFSKVYIDRTPPVISNIRVTDVTESGYTVLCDVTDDISLDRVQFPTWTENNGQDDIDSDWWSSTKSRGTLVSGNTYSFHVNISDHNNELGNYITHIYAYDSQGNWASGATSAQIQKKEEPKTENQTLTIQGIDSNTYNPSDMKEDVVALFFGRTSCYNTNSMIAKAEELLNRGTSIKIVLMDVDATDSGMQNFADSHPNVLVAHKDGGYGTLLFQLLKEQGISSNVVSLPGTFLMNRERVISYASTGLDTAALETAVGKLTTVPSVKEPSTGANTSQTTTSQQTTSSQQTTTPQQTITSSESGAGGILSNVETDTADNITRNAVEKGDTVSTSNSKNVSTGNGAATITLKAASKKIAAGKKITLKVSGSTVSKTKLKWKSSNKKYATVSADGVVTTKKAGAGKKVTITAEATDGSGQKATIVIRIMKGTVKKVTASAAKSVTAGKTTTIKTSVKASSGANKKLSFTSSNKKYATVSSKGKVTTYKAGKGKTVKITVAATDGSGKKTTVKIKIK